MPLFKRKTDKNKVPTEVKQPGNLKRTPSNRSRDLSNGTVSQGQVLSDNVFARDENIESIQRKSSQLCKTLEEILVDKNSLGYFIQFLEDRKAGQLVRFWLDAESFKAATWSRIRTHSLNTAKKKRQTWNDDGEDKCNTGSCAGANSGHKSLHCQNDDVAGDSKTNTFRNESSVINSSTCANKGSSSGGEVASHPVIKDVSQNIQGATNCPCDSANLINQKHSGYPDADMLSKNCDETKQAHKLHSDKDPSQNWTDKLKKCIEDDAVRIFNKYLAKDALDPIGVDDVCRNECISKICREDGEVDPECFVQSQALAVSKMKSEHYPSYNGSEFHLKYQIDLVTSGPIYLTDFLYYDPAFFYFMEFMEQEGGSNLLQFWIAVENFEKHLHSCEGGYDGMEAQSDAMVLYDKYFSLQATHPLGFNDKCRFDVEGNICQEEGPLPDCFAKPRVIVLKTIDKVYFSEFRQSELFYKFLSELVGTVHSSRELPKPRKRTDSEGSIGSSTHSGESLRSSAKNTLLATGTNLHLKKAMSKFENDMNIDSGLLNPDSLWKRDAQKMAMGTVDNLGQFKSDFNPHPDTEKAKGSGFFKRRKDKEKEDEEMAIKIAQMIISDVTSVTQTVGAMKSQSFNDRPSS